MREFLVVIASFLIIPVLSRRKVPIGISICACALIMAIAGGIGPDAFIGIILNTFFNPNKLQQFIIVSEVAVIGVLLKKYKIIDELLGHLTRVFSSNRLLLMFIPALIGMLIVPGGAMMSAPLIDQLGEKSNLTKSHRAIINLIYRHISMHIMPYATGFLIVMSLAPQISIYKLMLLNSIFVIMYVVAGYFLYIRRVQNHKASEHIFCWGNLFSFFKLSSPIYVAVLLNLMLGVPFYMGMLANLLVLFLLRPTETFLVDAAKAFNFNVLYALIGVYLIQGIIGSMEELTLFLTLVFSNPSTVMLGIIASSFFFGITTGYQPTALGVVLPILITLPLSDNQLLLYCHFTFMWGFVGYFFSPMHLCQLFTCEYLQVPTADLYREYWKFFVSLVIILVLNYFVMGFFLI
ncbi:putative membrane protein (plasmid) [Peptoclostridium acidaminophilum DSM 3953]|uniref:Putative membrane protein n=1 Tax=Peptoclostridium acidaminophilum DSM 3953 TaxID=1286171 RepID=W8TJ32_PEPAC|nr:DUF401 family protein [Peptoclostridium acidaminophilum]AHM57798.1 putative membrane protein [Peptoclostridium acidaminophilum DSM 3953]